MALCYYDGAQFIIVLAINISMEWHDFNFWHLWNYAEDGVGGEIVVLFAVNSINYMHLQALLCSSSHCHHAVAPAKGSDSESMKKMRSNSHPSTHINCELARCSDLHSEIMDTESNAPYCEHTACLRTLFNVSFCFALCHLLVHIYFMVKIIEVFRFH